MAQRQPIIAREGWIPVGLFFLAGLYVYDHWSGVAASALWIVAVLVAFYFRDPRRHVPPSPLAVISPVDGRVVSVGPAFDQRLSRDAVCIRIAMDPLGVLAIRSPIEGKVVQQWFARAGDDTIAQWVQSDEHDDVLLVAEPRLGSRRPFCRLQSGERVGQGERCGFLPLGATIDVYLPVNTRVLVMPGDHVQSGITALAKFIHK